MIQTLLQPLQRNIMIMRGGVVVVVKLRQQQLLDLGSEYQIIKRNYRNKAPQLKDDHGRVHQGWLGSKVRQKLMVEGKISYRLIVLQKKGVPEVLNGAAAVSAISSETRRGK